MREYSVGQAAGLLGVSADTVRRWADGGELPCRRGTGGQRTIAAEDLAAFAVELGSRGGHPEPDTRRTSARNSFPGIITRITVGDVAAQVEVQAGPHRVVALTTREAVEELGLQVGMEAVGSVKATNVMIDLPR
ncbi:MerR family transcriptional regulator [Mangrovactinospora gilvigrisea]|uniref:MerR family transcriptional regulator n=1 Tax=Mangrovactinospora gilvigrisea TaxID=1428644 RepID=A0A1J7C1B1_9ACTN|nr:TOBE domain-containing protein [Mangrovactinospora gilvigrisea]OIV35352.1 MerR family transcriptional regulator [Mangrovactinospora gilvigrisea]